MRLIRLVCAPAVLAGALFLVGTSPLRADDDCQKRTSKADHNLHEAIHKHGPDSPEANHWRSELAEARHYCWEHEHKWWDEDSHSWHDKQDWDDHDHEH
jgi:hypothetical protein